MMTSTKPSALELAANFRDAYLTKGFRVGVRDSVVTVTKHFTAGDKEAYGVCESQAYGLIAMVPASGGSTWGTDSGSVGGHVGLTNGYMTLNKSGVKKRFTAALTKLIQQG